MPLPNLHMTCLEITHSKTPTEISNLVSTLRHHAQSIASYTLHHRARLIKPMLSYDTSAIALSFVPSSAVAEEGDGDDGEEEDKFTYHHLRRDIYDLCQKAGVEIASRYTVPSAHLTIARFVTQRDIDVAAKPLGSTTQGEGKKEQDIADEGKGKSDNPEDIVDELDERYHPNIDTGKVKRMVDRLEALNEWLEREHWSSSAESHASELGPEITEKRKKKAGSEWIVGEGKGLDFRKGTLWYGGGETVCLGEGF